MKWIKDIFLKWHKGVHSNYDYTRLVEANKRIDELTAENWDLKKEVKKLKIQLEIKLMNTTLEV